MDVLVATLLSIWISFGMGVFIMLWLGRGFFGKYLKAFISGNALIRVHLNRGGFVFRVGKNVPSASIVKFNLWSKDDIRYITLVPEACLRSVRALWVDCSESDTAPFIFDRVAPYYKEVVDDKGVKSTVIAFKKFIGWDDSAVIRNIIKWALIRPRRKIANDVNFKAIIIVVIVVIIVGLIASQLFAGNTAGVENVIV